MDGRDLDSAEGAWQRAVRLGQFINEWADGSDRTSPDAADVAGYPELGNLIGVVEALTVSRTGIRTLLRQGVLRVSSDSAFQAELEHYGIVEVIGQGGMGVVLRAFDRRLDRDVALKIMRGDLASDPNARARFQREAKATAQLRHPNIVTIHEVGEAGGYPYLGMEYVDGPSLADYVREQGALEGNEIRGIFRQIVQGLAHAHDAGVVHRDIKSSNILLDGREGTARIADFGLAYVVGSQTRITRPDSVFGTPEYMSPEQAQGCDLIDERSDLYSAGVVLYEMLTGRVPFQAQLPSAVVHKLLNRVPEDPQNHVSRVDRHLAKLAVRLLAKRPEDRFDSAKAVLKALDQPTTVTVPERRRRLLHRVTAVLTVAVTVALAGGFWSRSMVPNDLMSGRGLLTKVAASHVQGGSAHQIIAQFGDDVTWRPFYEFEDERVNVYDAVVANVDGSGTRVVLAGVSDPAREVSLCVFDETGEELWSLNASDGRAWPDVSETSPWGCALVVAEDFDGVPGDELLVMCHGEDYPTRIAILDLQRRGFKSSFWHMGHIVQILVLDGFFSDGRPAIAARGLNNKLDGFDDELPGPRTASQWDITPVVMILDPLNMDGLGPPLTDRLPSLPTAAPMAYALLNTPYVRTVARIGVDPQTGERLPARADRVVPDDIFACINNLELPHAHQVTPESCLLAQLEGIDYNNNPRPRGGLLVNRDLVPLSYKPTNTGGDSSEFTLAYWREHWKIQTSQGTWVTP